MNDLEQLCQSPESKNSRKVVHAARSLPKCEATSLYLQSKDNEGRTVIGMNLPCGKKCCPTCSAAKTLSWLEAVAGHVALAFAVFAWRGESSDFPAYAKRVRRANGRYAAVHEKGGRCVVITDVPLAGADQIGHAEAVELFAGGLLDQDTSRRKPCSTSREWGKGSPPSSGRFRHVGFGPARHLARKVKALQDAGAVLKVLGDSSAYLLSFPSAVCVEKVRETVMVEIGHRRKTSSKEWESRPCPNSGWVREDMTT